MGALHKGTLQGMTRVLFTVGLAAMLVACSPSPSRQTTTTGIQTPEAAPSTETTVPASPASPIPESELPPFTVDSRSFTSVCSAGPEGDGRREVLACYSATEAAIRLTGSQVQISRTEFRYDLSCARFMACPNADPFRGFVLVGLSNGTVVAVAVVQLAGPGQGQVLSVYPAVPMDPSILRDEPGVAPPAVRTPIEGDPPPGVIDRGPLPYCGAEQEDPPNSVGRECFARAVAAGGKGEFLRQDNASDGTPMQELFRYDGSGVVEMWWDTGVTTGPSDRWQHLWCDVVLGPGPYWFGRGSCSGQMP